MRHLYFAGTAIAMLAATPAMALPKDFKAKADALLAQSYAADGPGASVVISDHGKIVYQGQRGLADVAAKRPITPHTVFRIGSITKQFSAAVVLQLVAEGKLKLSDPLSNYLPAYPNAAAITVEQLLNHTSGIQSYTGIPGWMVEANTNRAYTTAQLIDQFKSQPAPSKPGEKFDYNNSGYVLVGALIEAVTGNRWADEVNRRIARPLGLATLDDGVHEALIAGMATGYSAGEKGAEPAQKIHMSVPGAAGALVAKVGDLATWGNALHRGKVVPAPYYARMIAPTRLPDGRVEQYGYGLEPGEFRGTSSIGHSGGIFGFASDSLYLPSRDVFIAILTNSDRPKVSPGAVMFRLAAMAIGKPFPTFKTVPFDKTAVESSLGVYQFTDTKRTLSIDGGKLVIQREGRPTSDLFSAGNNRFHYGADELSWFELSRDAAGKPVMAMHSNGDDQPKMGTWSGPSPKLVVVAVPRATLATYTGAYSTPIGKATVALGEGEAMTIQLAGQPAFAMKAVSATSFAVAQVGATVHFVSADGKVSGLEIDQGGRKLPGTRD